MVDDLAGPIGNSETLFDEDLRDAVDDDDRRGDHRQQEVAASPTQVAATFSTLTRSSFPSRVSASEQAPSGGAPCST